MRFHDAHNHLQDPRLDPFRPAIIRDLATVPLGRAVINGTRESDWPGVLRIAREHPRFIPSIGLHPWHLKERSTTWKESLESALKHDCCAVGEIGLDRWMRDFDIAEQEEVFTAQLALAARFNRPATIHCLQAWGSLFEILSNAALPAGGFLLHSYSGSAEMIPRFASLGAYFSISGYFAHEKKLRQRDNFRLVPPDRLLIETDAPDMMPPTRYLDYPIENASERLNHPANIAAVYRFAAELLGTEVPELAARVEANFLRLFARVLD
jgi:TatD DNase family protein